MVNLIDTIVYAGRVKDKLVLMKSSSSGAFTALSDWGYSLSSTTLIYADYSERRAA